MLCHILVTKFLMRAIPAWSGQAHRQDFAAGVAKNHNLEKQYWMYAATRRSDMKCGSWVPLTPLLATTLVSGNLQIPNESENEGCYATLNLITFSWDT